MLSLDNPPVDIRTVEVLLRGRPPLSMETDCAETAAVAQVIAGFADPFRLEQVSDHLEQCRGCRDAVLMLNIIDGADPVAAERIGLLQPLRKRTGDRRARYLKVLSTAASILLVGGLAVYVIRELGNPAPSKTDMIAKGAPDNFFVGVRRGAYQFGAEPFDRLEKDDRLGMFYTAEQSGYLMVVSMDDSVSVSLLFPAGASDSGAIGAGDEVSLSDGALVREGSSCEWIVAAFSDSPLRFSDVTLAFKNATIAHGSCELRVSIPGARTVRVLPFRR